MTLPFPEAALELLPSERRPAFERRVGRWWRGAARALTELYEAGAAPLADRVARRLARAAARRDADLVRLDDTCDGRTTRFSGASALGYSAYVDRFGGDLRGTTERLDYLAELGVTYLHLLPLYETRPGDSDGGFAVADHRAVRADLGDEADLVALAREARRRGISLGLDLVLNHTAREHAWARAARRGEPGFVDRYLTFADRAQPDQYVPTLPEVFPRTAPGSFTWDDDLQRWVWTTFYPFQWDLDWRNPRIFDEMLGVALWLANVGGEVLRLDSAAYVWKRLGTDCRSLPEVHRIIAALRALLGIAAPAVELKAEAIVPARDVVPYFGRGEPECRLAYHNTLMASLWFALATGRADRIAETLRGIGPLPRGTAWVTYLRCHDDIGWWPLAPELGEGAQQVLSQVAAFYAGAAPDSFAEGRSFQAEGGGAHGTNGTLASLAGLHRARRSGEAAALDEALARLRLLHGVLFAVGGLPVLYMGDELGLPNDEEGADALVDGRWLHRPRMCWTAAARRHDPASVEGRVWATLRALVAARAACDVLRAEVPTETLGSPDPAVLILRRAAPDEAAITVVANFAAASRSTSHRGLDRLTGTPFHGTLPAWGVVWLTDG